ncbi:MAG: hypothetical protein IPH65_12115 [Dehalococcoidia bacterium]|uniref:hypothetical protein n=1 Tax=Candidatus Amarobacter glycogenicus TaxID=3140699 RepID=UPI0031373573|nr:hypothetical protein [Dehalococcoidia bacterium]
MQFTSEVTEMGVTERAFALEVAGDTYRASSGRLKVRPAHVPWSSWAMAARSTSGSIPCWPELGPTPGISAGR